ncbi:MAG: TolC family protein, partial [Gemmatimonadota bacterium]
MRPIAIVPLAAVLLLAAPCSAAGPPPPVPAAADNAVPVAADNAAPVAADNAAVPRVSLVDAVRASLERGRETRMAAQDVRIAEEGRARAAARYLPRVAAGADYTALSEPPSVIILGGTVQTMDQYVTRARVPAAQTIYDFGKTSSRVSQAAARRDAAEGQASATRARAAMDAIAAFLSAKRAEELTIVAAESLDTAREHRKVAIDRYELGVVARNDVLAADVQV